MAVSTSFIATAYGPPWGGIQGGGTTATGIQLPAGATGQVGPPYIVAVDPSVIPLHTKLKIWPNPAGDPNIVWQAEDTGGAIKGNRIDFLDLAGRSSQDGWGKRPVTVTVAGSGTPLTGGAGASSSSSGGGSLDWKKLLLDVVFVGIGMAAAYRGSRRLMSTGGGSS